MAENQKRQPGLLWVVSCIILVLVVSHCGPAIVSTSEREPRAEMKEESGSKSELQQDELFREPSAETKAERTPDASLSERTIPEGFFLEQPDDAGVPEPFRLPETCAPTTIVACRLPGLGDCGSGTRTCSKEQKWGACTIDRSRTSEVCDGRDNDCDGKIDEGFSKIDCCVPTVLASAYDWKSNRFNRYDYVTASPDGKKVAYLRTRSAHRIDVVIADIATKEKFLSIPANSSPWKIQYHTKKELLFIGGSGKDPKYPALIAFNTTTGKKVQEYKGRSVDPKYSSGNSKLVYIFFSPDGSLVTGAYTTPGKLDQPTQNQIVVWEVLSGKVVQTFTTNQTSIQGIGISWDNKHIATGSRTSQIKVWRMSDASLMHTLQFPRKTISFGVTSIDFHPKREEFIAASGFGEMRVWGTKTGQLLHTFRFPGGLFSGAVGLGGTYPYIVKYDPTGRFLLSAPFVFPVSSYSARGMYILNAKTYKTLHSFDLHRRDIATNNVLWSSDGQSFTIVEESKIATYRCRK